MKLITLFFLFVVTSTTYAEPEEHKALLSELTNKFLGKEYSFVQAWFKSKNIKELTSKEGIPRPDGGFYVLHKFLWNKVEEKECVVLVDIEKSSSKVWEIGLSGDFEVCNVK